MNTQRPRFSRLLLATAIAGTLGFASVASADDKPLSVEVREARMEGQIMGAYTLNRHLNPFKLSVDVDGRTATLTGEVEESVNKDLAEQIAVGVKGIDRVDNRITVNPRYQRDAGNERDFGDVVSDATVTTSVKSKLLWNQHTDGLDISVDTRDGVVTLKGVADSDATKELAERLADNTEGVRDVQNDLRVGTKSGNDSDVKAGADRAGDTISDSWITSKVKTTFLLSRNISGTDINIDTKDGVVTLSGAVDTGAEKELAVEVAKDIRGVKAVKANALEVNS